MLRFNLYYCKIALDYSNDCSCCYLTRYKTAADSIGVIPKQLFTDFKHLPLIATICWQLYAN